MEVGPTVKLKAEIELDGALVISCFPGVGMVSSIAAHFLIEQLNLKFIGGVQDPRLPPVCLIEDGVPLPPIRAYAGQPECNVKDCNKVVLLMSELHIPDKLVFQLVNSLFAWSESERIKAGLIIDAFARKGVAGGQKLGNEPMVEYEDTEAIDILGVGATEEVRKRLDSMDIPLIEQGVLRGMTATLLSEGRRRGLDLMAILVEADPRFPDARAAAELIKHLNTLLPTIELDEKPLLEEAERLEEQLVKMMEAQVSQPPPLSSERNSMLYG
ncbi:MAG: proteasome assembly chaperone family protein [Euryarchaeota archaeon]|nr:proteasome assembly chaperone family protein [Euryarchaeota archaeon]